MRISDSTVVCVWRVNIQESTGYFYATLVNLIVLGLTPETKTFSVQAADLKEIIALYNPREVVIDTNGLGVGLADEMIKETYAGNGKVYPAYGFKNDRNYQRIQPSNAINILIGMKAGNSSIKKNDGSPATPISAINGNAYTRINSGKVRFLIKEQEAKSALLATKVGQKMTPNQRIERLMPHTLTTRLFDEMANLRLKPNTVEVTVERINAHKPKDKFSALSYGLWRIKELEDEYSRTYKRKGRKRKLIFYN